MYFSEFLRSATFAAAISRIPFQVFIPTIALWAYRRPHQTWVSLLWSLRSRVKLSAFTSICARPFSRCQPPVNRTFPRLCPSCMCAKMFRLAAFQILASVNSMTKLTGITFSSTLTALALECTSCTVLFSLNTIFNV